jgi:hypothetical protein
MALLRLADDRFMLLLAGFEANIELVPCHVEFDSRVSVIVI